MGSDIKRRKKKKDIIIIKTPLEGSSVISSTSGLPELVAETCISSFEERIEESPIVKAGIKVTLNQYGDRYSIMILNTEIGMLSKRNSIRIRECLLLSVHYSGEIVEKKGVYYARFYRQLD